MKYAWRFSVDKMFCIWSRTFSKNYESTTFKRKHKKDNSKHRSKLKNKVKKCFNFANPNHFF